MTTVKEIVDLYWEVQKAEEHYADSTEGKARAVGLAEEFHDLMVKLRKAIGKGSRNHE